MTAHSAAGYHPEPATRDLLHPLKQRRVHVTVSTQTADDDLHERLLPDLAAKRRKELTNPVLDPADLAFVQPNRGILSHQTNHAVTLPHPDPATGLARSRNLGHLVQHQLGRKRQASGGT